MHVRNISVQVVCLDTVISNDQKLCGSSKLFLDVLTDYQL